MALRYYKSYAPILKQSVRAAFWRFRGKVRLEDLQAEANYIHVKCRRFYRPEWGPFENYLRFKLRTGLIEMVRREITQRQGLRSKNGTRSTIISLKGINDNIPQQEPRPYWLDQLSEVSHDAQLLSQLALQSRAGMPASEIRKALIQYVLELQWTARKICQTFHEILEALQ